MRPSIGFLGNASLITVLFACGSGSGSSGTAPVISNLTIMSPVAAGAAVSGQIDATDTAGLSNLTLNLTLSEGGQTLGTISNAVSGGSSADNATIPFLVELSLATPAGAYSLTVTLSEDGATSNALSGSLVIQ